MSCRLLAAAKKIRFFYIFKRPVFQSKQILVCWLLLFVEVIVVGSTALQPLEIFVSFELAGSLSATSDRPNDRIFGLARSFETSGFDSAARRSQARSLEGKSKHGRVRDLFTYIDCYLYFSSIYFGPTTTNVSIPIRPWSTILARADNRINLVARIILASDDECDRIWDRKYDPLKASREMRPHCHCVCLFFYSFAACEFRLLRLIEKACSIYSRSRL